MSRRARLFAMLAITAVLLTAGEVQGRIWTDRSGRTIEADFVRVDGTNVIVSRQGKEIPIPLERLSDADQEYIKTARPPASGGGGSATDDNPFADGNKSGNGSKPSDGSDEDKEPEKPGKYPLRNWRDRTGSQVRARFVVVQGQDIVLERNNGIRLNVPFHTLVEPDQEYVEKELKKAGTPHLIPSRAPPQNNLGAGGGQPPAGGYAPPGGFSSPPGGGGDFGSPSPMGKGGFMGSPPGYSSPPGGFGSGVPPNQDDGSGSPGNSGGLPPSFGSPPPGGIGGSPPGYSSPPSSAPPGGYSSPPSGAPPGGFGPPGGSSSPPNFSAPPSGPGDFGGPPSGGFAPPGGYSSPPSSGPPSFGPPSFGPPAGPVFGPNGPGFEETYFCTNCNKQLPKTVKAGDRCPHCRAFLAYEEGPNGQKKYASGGAMVGYFVLGGGGLTAIAVVIGIVIRVIVSAVRD